MFSRFITLLVILFKKLNGNIFAVNPEIDVVLEEGGYEIPYTQRLIYKLKENPLKPLIFDLFLRLYLRRQQCPEVDDFDNDESCRIACEEGCVYCDYGLDGKNICFKCAPNYFFYPLDDSCIKCPKECPDCIESPNTW